MTGPRTAGASLQVRFVVGLLVIALVPLAVSAMLIPEIATGAAESAATQVVRLREYLARGSDAYRDLIETKKQLHRETARRLAQSAAATQAVTADPPDLTALAALIGDAADLREVAVVGPDGVVRAHTPRRALAQDDGRFRDRIVTEPIPGTSWSLELTFAADLGLLEEHSALAKAIEISERAEKVQTQLPRSYLIAFLVLVGGVVVIVTAVGLVSARRLSRRIALLVSGTRQIAEGDLAARVDVGGRDELSELASAFNGMVQELESDRAKILYLQRIGAWQDVARKLAHEIKNPLTPIQLAVQQAVSSYRGDDERFRKLLADTAEIVEEEIANLRRLVDAFSALGRLPRVEATSLDLADVVDDLTRDPVFQSGLVVRAPERPVRVRADRLLLRRVVANLVENGMQAGASGDSPGEVVVGWTANELRGVAVMTVDDRGPGVPVADRERIFEPYVTSKETGTGLGLAISKKIALDHQGTLAVAAERAPTGGARFVLTVPLER